MRSALRVIPGGIPAPRRRLDHKLQALGTHVAHVVHELRVPLSLVVGSLQTIEQFVAASADLVAAMSDHAYDDPRVASLFADADLGYLAAEAPNLIAICREGVARIDHVLAQLRGYAGTVHPERFSLLCMETILREAANLASAGRNHRTQVQEVFEAVPMIRGDGRALSQVFVNLIANAFDALASTADGHVHLGVRSCAQSACTACTTQPHVHASVEDNGPGLPDHLAASVFEPFVSLKAGTTGLGLGLAIAKEIVQAHGGEIRAETGRSCGARFEVTLPY
ncbi:MAG: HAMP domain-containing histidine kinase [Deltaproteobacteria bacterium]|nr:HAMP domain-containing histidine kinase [Deltaproteobacteria bacterium]